MVTDGIEENKIQGVYRYFWDVLHDQNFISVYFSGNNHLLAQYLQGPGENENLYQLVKGICDHHAKTDTTLAALVGLNETEQSIGQLKPSHRSHLIHSINVFFLGLCLMEQHPKLRERLLMRPGEEVKSDSANWKEQERRNTFYFRWIFASFFHDIGYMYELPAKALWPDKEDNPWHGIGVLTSDIERLKSGIPKFVRKRFRSLKNFPLIPFIEGYDDNATYPNSAEGKGREVAETSNILELMAHIISRSHEGTLKNKKEVFKALNKTFQKSFQIGDKKTFDHGKIGAFILLHEMRNVYTRHRFNKSSEDLKRSPRYWQRANVYFDLMDSAIAIYLHNTLRFDEDIRKSWGPYSAENIPPLSYLLMLCDLLVEWDKPQLGYDHDGEKIKAKQVNIECGTDGQINVNYSHAEKTAVDVWTKINKLFDLEYLKIVIR